MPRTILVADKSVTIRKVVELTFSDTEIRVETASTGGEALDRFARLEPDLVLADVSMPEPSGYEVCRAVKASSRPVPVLLLAGAFESFDPDRARRSGADGHVTKPFESGALVEQVEALLAAPPAAPETQADAEPAAPDPELDSVLHDLAAASPQDFDPSPRAGENGVGGLSEEAVEAIVRIVLARLSHDLVRDIARQVVLEVAERVVRERIRELEREGSDPGA